MIRILSSENHTAISGFMTLYSESVENGSKAKSRSAKKSSKILVEQPAKRVMLKSLRKYLCFSFESKEISCSIAETSMIHREESVAGGFSAALNVSAVSSRVGEAAQ